MQSVAVRISGGNPHDIYDIDHTVCCLLFHILIKLPLLWDSLHQFHHLSNRLFQFLYMLRLSKIRSCAECITTYYKLFSQIGLYVHCGNNGNAHKQSKVMLTLSPLSNAVTVVSITFILLASLWIFTNRSYDSATIQVCTIIRCKCTFACASTSRTFGTYNLSVSGSQSSLDTSFTFTVTPFTQSS